MPSSNKRSKHFTHLQIKLQILEKSVEGAYTVVLPKNRL
jgi:hypothetical protein